MLFTSPVTCAGALQGNMSVRALLSGVFFSSWFGSSLLALGEWIIKRLPLIKHIYSASKQVSSAINPQNESSKAFQECVLIRHPRSKEFAIAFINGQDFAAGVYAETHSRTHVRVL